jgi:RNA polymerase sigma factor (sigma-70 family)
VAGVDTSIGRSGPAGFPDTNWNAILSAGARGGAAKESLETFVRGYWRPLYAYSRARFGMANEEAKDCVQEFFTHVLQIDWLSGVREGEGRFRNFLRVTFENFARNFTRGQRRARKRSGGTGGELANVPDPEPWNPENVWDEAWKRMLLRRALDHLEEEFKLRGKESIVKMFRRYYLDREGEAIDYRALAAEHGVSVSDVVNRLHAARTRYRQILGQLVRRTTGSLDDARAEFRVLFGAELP